MEKEVKPFIISNPGPKLQAKTVVYDLLATFSNAAPSWFAKSFGLRSNKYFVVAVYYFKRIGQSKEKLYPISGSSLSHSWLFLLCQNFALCRAERLSP